MPLGSESTLGLAGPNGMPLIGELPAPADPAGGVNCAKAGAGKIRLPNAKARTSAQLRDIELSPGLYRGSTFKDDLGRAFPQGGIPVFSRVVVRRNGPVQGPLQSDRERAQRLYLQGHRYSDAEQR